LGLLFGFQRPSRLSYQRLSATVLLVAACRFQPAGLHLLFESESVVNFGFSSSRPLEVFSAAQWLPLFLSRGRGFYLFAASRVNRCFVDRPNQVARSTSSRAFLRRGRGFYFIAASCVNSLR
jgi:hypothetical protein